MTTRRPQRPPRVAPATTYRRLTSRAQARGVLVSALFPRDLHDRAKMMGVTLRWSMSEILREALAAWLDRHERGVVPVRRVGGAR
jgi:hypothetical protein